MNELTILLLLGLGSVSGYGAISVARQRWLAVTGCVAAGVLLVWQLLVHAPLVAGLLAAIAGGGVWMRWSRSASTVSRWGNRTRRKRGVASMVDIARKGSAWAMRSQTGVVRPSLAGLGWWQRMRLPATEVAMRVCRVGAQWVWASIEDVIIVFGGPRIGKTGFLAGLILDAPGAVLCTSTRVDLHRLTWELRGREDRPVWVFNPGGVGELDSTVVFDPLTGCEDPMIATERAHDMIPAAEGDAERWDAQARRVLAVLLHAAALLRTITPTTPTTPTSAPTSPEAPLAAGGAGDSAGRVSMGLVAQWVADPVGAENQIQWALRRSPDAASVTEVARQFIKTNDRTRTSITHSIAPALAWLTSPTAVNATRGGHQLDIHELLQARGTVYMLGRHEAHTAPLVAALNGYLAREARRLAALKPGGRLDPPLRLVLDEAGRVAPVPLPDWSGDAGGSGLTIVAAFQSKADVVNTWGETGASKVINNAGEIALFGGTKDPNDLEYWSRLAGDRDEPVLTRDSQGRVTSRSVRKVPVMAPTQLAGLPKGRVVLFKTGMPPAIGTAQMAWHRADVRDTPSAHEDTGRETTGWQTEPVGEVRGMPPWHPGTNTEPREAGDAAAAATMAAASPGIPDTPTSSRRPVLRVIATRQDREARR